MPSPAWQQTQSYIFSEPTITTPDRQGVIKPIVPPSDKQDRAGFDADRALVAGLVAGEPGAAETFVRRYGPMIRNLAMNRYHCDEALALDLFQKLFLHLSENDWRRLRHWNGRGRLRSYLYTMAKRLLLEELELRGHAVSDHDIDDLSRRLESEFLAEPGEWIPAADREALIRCLREAMERLSFKDRQLLRWRHWEQRKQREIAAIEGLSISNVGVSLMRAEKRLAAWMERLCAHLLGLIGRRDA